ncbi:hypothetical protein OIE43_22400 [Streptomyces pseudovenezuelae]|uniref:hypothetical protein n=1 Tax=Streptomyces pseudovenezuelae TaxID=67350 RepID=UPI002E3329E8|nr:hypothetical protein [Streptomyces pseudovenezuelae]
MKNFLRESPDDDNARTLRLLDATDTAFAHESATELGADFEQVVLEGLLTDRAVEVYPPAGHSYPRKD